MGQTSRRLRTAAGILFALVVVSLLSLNLARTLRTRKQDSQPPVSPSVMGVFSRWGIVGHHECGNTTRNILRQNGTVGDVAVAATLCMCVALPNRCGIGGGLYAIYYSGQAQQAIVVDGHETAPAAANWKTYEGTGHTLNAMYVGVPGQMAALETILNVTGTAVPWPNLFADAIALARDGFPISPELAAIIASKPEIGSSALRDIFWRDGRPLKAGETLVQRALAATLHGLSQRKASVYEGPLAAVLAGDLHAEGGLLTEKDLASYRVNVTMPVAFALPKGHTLLAPRPPAGGLYLGLVLGVMGHFVHPDGSLTDDSSTAHRFVESLKFAFSRRNVLADPQFADIDGIVTEATSPETVATIARIINSRMGPSAEPSYYGSPFHGSLGAGTAHFGFLAPNGDAIVVSSSLNSWFGSMVLSRSTGVIFNDVIRDFDLPYEVDRYNLSKTPRNQVSPGHRPLSTLTPSLVVRDGYGVAMAVSGSGGGRTISGIAQVVMRELWMDQTLKRAVDWGRLHHQFIPDTLYAESTVSREIVDTLKFLGHKTEVQGTWPSDVMAMARRFGEGNSGDRIYATYDFRRQTNNFVDGE
ncbi:scoloptoxin SSD14-like [Dermacentor silvarum]|uniref:scoloptoxin SSD14-like n=1 Tax=Dermacentor silvarum TaxID=543639 RepID=UPI00210197CB|nr:scoloptoxin SSD14-like [Dermacentor silvarum]